MPTINSILATATTGLKTQQAALGVSAHNIANASTDGYARQRAVIVANPALITPQGAFGTGAGVVDVQQVRDTLLDANYRNETTVASENQSRSDMLSRVETILGEPSDNGLGATMDQFFSAWSDLASSPGTDSVRSVVRERGSELVDKFHELSANLDQVRQEVESRLETGVDRVNQLTDQVSQLNQQIVSVEADGKTAGDLRDSRNKALDELSGLIPITVTDRSNGSVGVATSGINIVDGADHESLEAVTAGGTWSLQITGRPGALPDVGGSLGGYVQVLNQDLPSYAKSLDDLASGLVTDINALHETGTNPAGNTGVDFFDPAGVTAWTLDLSGDVRATTDAIAAGTPDGSGGYRAGANDVALSIGGLRDTDLAGLGKTPGEQLQGLVSDIGLAVRSSSDAATVHGSLSDQADTRRMSLSGVSVDEELVTMIQFQTAYQAAARLVSVADEMMKSLLSV